MQVHVHLQGLARDGSSVLSFIHSLILSFNSDTY